MKVLTTIFIFFLLPTTNFAQAKPAQNERANGARLGMTCAQVLAMSSTEWVAKFTAAKDDQPERTLLAIEEYGKCYDARTNSLAASLGIHGKGPLMGARGNFADFESALKNFTVMALEAAQQSSTIALAPVKTEYAALHEREFRYAFYEGYSQELQKRPPSGTTQSSDGAANASATGAQPAAKPEIEPMTLAKNRFGELLAAIPEDKRHEIHAAFGQIFEHSAIGEPWKLEIYRYAIFLLEPSAGKPFSPPPF